MLVFRTNRISETGNFGVLLLKQALAATHVRVCLALSIRFVHFFYSYIFIFKTLFARVYHCRAAIASLLCYVLRDDCHFLRPLSGLDTLKIWNSINLQNSQYGQKKKKKTNLENCEQTD